MSETRYTTTDTTKFTLYDILQVAPNASLDDIKSSFYRLARQHHPDKQKQEPQHCRSTTTTTTTTTTTNNNNNCNNDAYATVNRHFPDIQRAWELLRDSDQRRVYDQELLQQRLQHDSRHHGAISLDFKDLESAIDEETQEIFYVYDCRCGEEIHIDHDMMQGSSRKNNKDTSTANNHHHDHVLMVDCPGCCFIYKVHWI
jgi:curved DNA-binding protein CbpA